jgi:hypothetical protein
MALRKSAFFFGVAAAARLRAPWPAPRSALGIEVIRIEGMLWLSRSCVRLLRGFS